MRISCANKFFLCVLLIGSANISYATWNNSIVVNVSNLNLAGEWRVACHYSWSDSSGLVRQTGCSPGELANITNADSSMTVAGTLGHEVYIKSPNRANVDANIYLESKSISGVVDYVTNIFIDYYQVVNNSAKLRGTVQIPINYKNGKVSSFPYLQSVSGYDDYVGWCPGYSGSTYYSAVIRQPGSGDITNTIEWTAPGVKYQPQHGQRFAQKVGEQLQASMSGITIDSASYEYDKDSEMSNFSIITRNTTSWGSSGNPYSGQESSASDCLNSTDV